MASVFLWMFIALGISAGLAYWFANDYTLLSYLVDPLTGGTSLLGKIAMFAPLGFVLLMSYGFQKLPYGVLIVLFTTYAAITGISLSFILLAYTASSIYGCFITASLLFGVMAIAGYTTSQDLTKMGSILIMLLIGLVIASIVNWFLKSDQLDYILSFIGVVIFVGLTAYDVQKLKKISYSANELGEVQMSKLSIIGALTLYLDFINLFLYLLRLFGRRK
nr:Bax inhibitor-1/YccA family protein [Pedobacter sp. SYSU D00823]